MKIALINLRLALVSIAIDLAEISLSHAQRRFNRLVQRETDLRIKYCQARPLRHSIIMPE